MENVINLILKIVDHYLLPAVASTFIGILYFIYKCDGTNPRRETLMIFRKIFPGKKVEKSMEAQPKRPSEMRTLIPHAPGTQTVAIQIQSDLPSELPHKNFKEQDCAYRNKLYASKEKYNAKICDRIASNSLELFCDSSDQLKTMQEIEPVWDYYDVVATSKVQANNLESEELACEDTFLGGFGYLSKENCIPNAPHELLQEDIIDSKCFDEERWFSDNEAVSMNLYGKNYWQFVFE